MSEGQKTFETLYAELAELNKQWAEFVAFYLANGRNGAKAARDAGYAESSARVQAHRLITNDNISEVLEAYWREVQVSSDEILAILANQARASMEPFLELDEETGLVDVNLTSEDARANLHLIKKLKSRSRVLESKSDSDYVVVDQSIEFELHDAKDAAKVLAKHKGLLTDKLQIEDGPERAKRSARERREELEHLERVIAQRRIEEEEE